MATERNAPERRSVYTPHITAGAIPVAELRQLVETLQAAGAETVKLGGEIVFVWGEGEESPAGIEELTGRSGTDFRVGGIRPAKLCSAETFCQRFQQPVLSLVQKIDDTFYGRSISAKLTIGVAGCQRSCSEPAVKDVGIIATPRGYNILVGGNAGYKPRIAERVTALETEDEVIAFIEKVVDYVNAYCVKPERLGATIAKRGWHDFYAAVGIVGAAIDQTEAN